MVQLTDTLDATTTARICADGCLVADVKAARVGIQTYLRSETDAPANFTGNMVRVYRPESEVFSRDSMASFAAAPFTIDHPAQPVDAQNWRDLGVGEVNGDVVRDGGFVRVPVIVRDASAVEKVRTTHKQLSMGYSCSLDWTPGTTPDGQAYDAVQREIRINHIAAVRAARGGPELKISDERPPQEKPTMKIKIGDAEVDATNGEAVRIAVDALNKKLTDAQTALSDATTAHDKALAAKDSEIDELKTKVVDQAAIDKLADAKAQVVTRAKELLGDKAPDFAGKTVADVRRETVRIIKGDEAVADKSDDYVEARFDGLTDGKPTTVQSITAPRTTTNDNASVRDFVRSAQFA
jgi:hypothetical protein